MISKNASGASGMSQDLTKVGAIAIASLVFLIDSISTLDVAIAVLYVVVILISINVFSRQGVARITAMCIGLTLIAYYISHGIDGDDESFGRCLISLAAIACTAYLALKDKAAQVHLENQVNLLNRSEEFLAGTQRLSLTGTIGFMMPCTEMYWSEEAKRIFEFDETHKPSLEEMVKLIDPEDQSRMRAVIHEVRTDHTHLEVEFRVMMADGRRKTLRMLARPFEETENSCEFIGALMDVTATRAAEEALHRSQAELAHITRVTTLGELAASIAHEVNQPLAAVITNAESGLRWLNRAEPDEGEVRSAIERIIVQANRASDVVKRVRALSRKAVAASESLSISEVVQESLSLVEREIKRNKVSLRLQVSESTPMVNGDKVQLQQVIINLIMNAVQSMTQNTSNSRELCVNVCRSEPDHVSVIIRDNGPGILRENIVSVFEPFFTTKPKGVGMGLAICRSIVEAHGGRIWADNASGDGAVFSISLPQYGRANI